jgi:hypothetical protein
LDVLPKVAFHFHTVVKEEVAAAARAAVAVAVSR